MEVLSIRVPTAFLLILQLLQGDVVRLAENLLQFDRIIGMGGDRLGSSEH